MEADLRALLGRDRAAIEQQLSQALKTGDCPPRLMEATAHALLGGGKRLRACITLASGRLFDVPESASLKAGCAIEALHAYSLVHDDLPDMDDDDMRRGRPTVHKAYDPATAILVGDGLQALGFEFLSQIDEVPSSRVLALVGELAHGAGLWGMVGGQMRDMEAETRQSAPADPDHDIALIQSMKTGALFRWSACAGAILAGRDPAPLARYADALGLAFQVHDDILDVEGDARDMGKAVGKDAGAGKATFVSLLGIDGAKARAAALKDEAIEALAPYGEAGQTLAQLAQYAITRRH